MIFIGFSALNVSSATAQTSVDGGETLWLAEENEAEVWTEIFAGIEDALAAERDSHLLGLEQLEERVAKQPSEPWECAVGAEPCGSAEEMIFDALHLGLLVRLNIVDRGDDEIEINYEMVDRRGEITSSGIVAGKEGRQLGLELVGELFDAVGVVSFESSPKGAVVESGGEKLGVTPLTEQLEVGSHDYRVLLEGYDDAEGSFEVTTGELKRVEVELGERPGRLRIEGAPQGAVLWVDDEEYGPATEVAELAAGRHVVEVRAQGYETYRRSIELEPERSKELEVDMRVMPPFLRDVDASEMAKHRFQFDAGLELGRQRSEMHGARGEIDGDPLFLEGFGADADALFADAGEFDRRFVAAPGLRISAAWEGEGEWFGLGLLSLSYSGHGLDESVLLRRRSPEVSSEETLQRGTMTSMHSLQLRPMQLRGRIFYENLAPWAQVGLGLDVQRMQVELDDGEEVRLARNDAFASLEVGLRYHFDPRWSVGGSVRMQGYFDDGVGSKYTMGISVGTGLRDLPGLDSGPPGEL